MPDPVESWDEFKKRMEGGAGLEPTGVPAEIPVEEDWTAFKNRMGGTDSPQTVPDGKGGFTRTMELLGRPGQLGAGLVTDKQAGLRGLISGEMGLGDVIATQEAKAGVMPRIGEMIFDPLNLAGVGLFKAGIRGINALRGARGGPRAVKVGENVVTKVPTHPPDELPFLGLGGPVARELPTPYPLPTGRAASGPDMVLPGLERAAPDTSFLNRTLGFTTPRSWADVRRGFGGALGTEGVTPVGIGRGIKEEAGKLTPGGVIRGVPNAAVETLGLIPRAIITSGEHSAVLRQGFFETISRPREAGRAFKRSMSTLFSEANADEIDAARKAKPYFDEAKRAGQFHAETNLGLEKGEEVFLSRWVGKIPLVSSTVKASSRLYSTYLNELRGEVTEQVIKNWESSGTHTSQQVMDEEAVKLGFGSMKNLRQVAEVEGAELPAGATELVALEAARFRDLQDWVSFVNHATGRGGLPSGEKLNRVLSIAFFAPRLLVSYPQTMLDLVKPGTSGQVRKLIARDLGVSTITGMSVIALASKIPGVDVNVNPLSSDFGKIRIGTQRINVFGGYQPIIRLVAQMGAGAKASVSTGKVREDGASDIIISFLEGKLSPLGGLIRDLAPIRTGERPTNFVGQPMEGTLAGVGKEVGDRLVPLFWQDVADSLREEGWKGVARSTPGLLGIGVQTFRTELERYWQGIGGEGKFSTLDPTTQRMIERRFRAQKKRDKKPPLFTPPWAPKPEFPFRPFSGR